MICLGCLSLPKYWGKIGLVGLLGGVLINLSQNKYTIYPKWSKIQNIGFDEKGTHNNSPNKKWETILYHKKLKFYKDIEVNENIIECFQAYYNLSLYTKIGYFLRKYGGYRFIKKILK